MNISDPIGSMIAAGALVSIATGMVVIGAAMSNPITAPATLFWLQVTGDAVRRFNNSGDPNG